MDFQAQLLSTRQVLKRLGWSRTTFSRFVAEGNLTPALKGDGARGGQWFRVEDVNAIAEAEAEKLRARLAQLDGDDRASA